MRLILTTAMVTGVVLTGAFATAEAAFAAPRPGITAVQCQDGGGKVITILGRGTCVGGTHEWQSVNG